MLGGVLSLTSTPISVLFLILFCAAPSPVRSRVRLLFIFFTNALGACLTPSPVSWGKVGVGVERGSAGCLLSALPRPNSTNDAAEGNRRGSAIIILPSAPLRRSAPGRSPQPL